ncbi:MAG: PadR family transcriptional regulator [Phycisphaerales bacterium JB040]
MSTVSTDSKSSRASENGRQGSGDEPSRLENFVLAYVQKHQPITPYAVRMMIEKNLSTTFSSSAGSIYPLMRRLEKRGLMKSVASARGKRKHVEYSVTPAGKKAVRDWVRPPYDQGDLWPTDGLRERFHYLNLLSRAEQKAWIEHARTELEAGLERLKTLPEPPEGFETQIALVRSNVRRINKARLAWLKEVEESLDQIRSGD